MMTSSQQSAASTAAIYGPHAGIPFDDLTLAQQAERLAFIRENEGNPRWRRRTGGLTGTRLPEFHDQSRQASISR